MPAGVLLRGAARQQWRLFGHAVLWDGADLLRCYKLAWWRSLAQPEDVHHGTLLENERQQPASLVQDAGLR